VGHAGRRSGRRRRGTHGRGSPGNTVVAEANEARRALQRAGRVLDAQHRCGSGVMRLSLSNPSIPPRDGFAGQPARGWSAGGETAERRITRTTAAEPGFAVPGRSAPPVRCQIRVLTQLVRDVLDPPTGRGPRLVEVDRSGDPRHGGSAAARAGGAETRRPVVWSKPVREPNELVDLPTWTVACPRRVVHDPGGRRAGAACGIAPACCRSPRAAWGIPGTAQMGK